MANSDLDNPFNITKATDFTNQQIAEYWVDFHTSNGEDLVYYLNPHDLTPKYIIGGKGCGKTHLLRYYSFPLQLLRHSNSAAQVLRNDKYIGLNIDLGAMNSARMFGCGLEEDRWDAIFGYYLELFIAINLLNVVQTIFEDIGISVDKQIGFIENVKRVLCQQSDIRFESTLPGLSEYINDLKKNVDYNVNNAALKRSISESDLQIKFSPGDIVFKLPALLASEFKEFSEVNFVFILDELEKLREYQKIYVNTLVWDKRSPSTFWIGARTYGFTTRATKSGEILRNGSEIREIRLDQIMQENEDKYKDFAVNLCARRLRDIIGDMSSFETSKKKQQIDGYFETFDENTLFETLKNKNGLRHQREFK